MSGFDLGDLLPFYLDETDEQITGLNEMLLKLEGNPGDEKSLREAFRLVHSIKGSSTIMGFRQVKELTHHLETFFDQIRAGERVLDRPFLNLCFQCLDGLRDYHSELRAEGKGSVDLAELTALVVARLEGTETAAQMPPAALAAPEPGPSIPHEPEPAGQVEAVATSAGVPPLDPAGATGVVAVRVTFEPNIPWPDMKARLVLNRLSARGRVVATEPAVEKLDEVEALRQFTVWLESDGAVDEFQSLADVDGVSAIDITTAARSTGAPAADERAKPAGTPADEVDRPIPPPPAAIEPSTEAAGPIARSEPAPAQPADSRKTRVVETVRVDADRLDHLMNLAGELVITKARFAEVARGLEETFRGSSAELLGADTMDRLDTILRALEEKDAESGTNVRWAAQFRRLRENVRAILDDLEQVRLGRERINSMSEAIHHLGRISDGIQKGVLETRMVPIGPLFDRFQRVVRDLRVSSNKEVTLEIEGEKTELDKRMIDELSDPLVHMVRNSVDHGLELPDARAAAGKPRMGRVLLAASHRGNSVVITVSDDGRGIDCARVRGKAVAKGLLSEEDARRLTDRQVIPFIFHPGLSTAERVTDISGRGVGMDIVKSRIEALNGTLDVRSELGVGTMFTIRLPLTLAIMPVLLVRVGGEAYAIPLDHLAEIVEVQPEQVYRVQGRPSIEVRGLIIALVKLSDLFRRRPDSTDGAPASGKQTVVVVTNGESTVGLVVDQLLGMQEAVLKSLEKNFRPVAGLSGASILGDGRVSLILDIDAMIDMATLERVSRPA
jgi:two-component system chemotaxis sensor kinase CheA